MTNSFEFIKTDLSNFPIIVIGRSYSGLSEYISDVEHLLCNASFRGNVIFDLLLANGYRAKNRFITSYFNGKYFIELHVTNITQKDVQIIKYLEKYYFDDLQILSNGILSKKDINSIITTHSIISKKDNLETQNT